MPLPRPTARLNTPPLSHPGPSCHAAASVPRSAPGPWTRDWTLRTLTLVHSLAPRLPSADQWGTLPLLCSSRFAGPPGFPSPTALEVQHDPQVPFDFVPSLPQVTDTRHQYRPCKNIKCVSACRTPGAGCQYRPCGNTNCCSALQSSEAKMPVLPMREDRLRYAMLIARDTSPSPNQRRLCFPCRASQRRLGGPVPPAVSVSDLTHHQYRLSVLQWNPGPARKNDTQIIPAACGRFHAVILQEAVGRVPHISENFYTYIDVTTSPSCSTRTRSFRAPRSSPLPKPPQAKTPGDLLLFSYVTCYDAYPLLTLPQSRFAQFTPAQQSFKEPRQSLFYSTFVNT